MKILLIICICIFSFFESKSQENEIYFVKSLTGLIVREQPEIESKRLGKLPYGSTVTLLERTELTKKIIDDGDTLNGIWLKIEYYNFPFIVSDSISGYGQEEEGYVFSGYLEKLIKARVNFKEIDSLKFCSLFTNSKRSNPIKITSNEKIERLLESEVKWKNVEYLGWTIDHIISDNGQILYINQKSNDCSLVAYYPSEKILLFECGHNSDYSISIKTGEALETVGNPEYIVESPNNKIRLNGWFSGQECSNYFFQEKIGSDYIYLVDFGWGSENFGNDVCNFNKFCWINDVEFVYSYIDYSDDTLKEKYFIGEIKK